MLIFSILASLAVGVVAAVVVLGAIAMLHGDHPTEGLRLFFTIGPACIVVGTALVFHAAVFQGNLQKAKERACEQREGLMIEGVCFTDKKFIEAFKQLEN